MDRRLRIVRVYIADANLFWHYTSHIGDRRRREFTFLLPILVRLNNFECYQVSYMNTVKSKKATTRETTYISRVNFFSTTKSFYDYVYWEYSTETVAFADRKAFTALIIMCSYLSFREVCTIAPKIRCATRRISRYIPSMMVKICSSEMSTILQALAQDLIWLQNGWTRSYRSKNEVVMLSYVLCSQFQSSWLWKGRLEGTV